MLIFGLGSALAQPQTYVVKVNPDGSFAPQVVYIKSGDTVRWEQLSRTDSIIASNGGSYPAICTNRKAYSASDPNDPTGPLPFAASGIFTLSPLGAGLVEATGTCPGGGRGILQGDNGKVLCLGGQYEASMDSTWSSDQATGVFLRLLWKDVNPQPGIFDFTVLQREMDQAVRNGKVYSLGIKAGDDGTPDWIFSTNANGTPRANGGGGVPRLSLQDPGDGAVSSCGPKMDMGNPTRATYRQLYSNLLTEVAKFIKSRADWYRALTYIKISGANLISHENRLPATCEAAGANQCVCNPAVFSADGYRPSGLYAFYDEQEQLMKSLFPGKAMSYALIQAGFPRVSETGGYLTIDGTSSDRSVLPDGVEQTQTILDRGQLTHGINFVVQHNGIGPKPATTCNFDGVHPKPDRILTAYWDVGSGCPNRWAVKEGAQGQITGFQTNNRGGGVNTPADVHSSLQNAWDNSDAVFFEIYEDVFWEAANKNRGILTSAGKTIGNWADDFHRRRNDPIFPNFIAAKNPFPTTYSKTFTKLAQGSDPQNLFYVHGMKCGLGKQEWGQIVIDAQPPSIKAGGVISAAAFGGSTSIAPGSWIEIYGSNFAGITRSWGGADFNGLNAPTVLDGTTVKIGGQSAFVDFISPGQVNVQVPSNVPLGSQPITITSVVGTSAPLSVTVNSVQPGLLATPLFNIGGRQYVVALFPDGNYVLPPGSIPGVPSRRAKPGETITLYGIGFGPVTPNIPAGQIVQAGNSLSLPFQLQIGQSPATTPYFGLAPGAVGLYQFNVIVPNVAASDSVALSFTLAGTSGSQVLFIPVQN